MVARTRTPMVFVNGGLVPGGDVVDDGPEPVAGVKPPSGMVEVGYFEVTTPTQNIDFPNLGGYSALLVKVRDLVTNTAGTDAPILRTSTDNGATFATTGYEPYGTTTTTSVSPSAAGAAATVFGFDIEVSDFNSATRRTQMAVRAAVKASTTATSRLVDRPLEVNNALRITTLSGAQFTAGRVVVYARA